MSVVIDIMERWSRSIAAILQRHYAWSLTGICIFGAIIRILRYSIIPWLDRDVYSYYDWCRIISSGTAQSGACADFNIPPLLILSMAFFERMCGGGITAGICINILSGSLLGIPIFIICRKLFKRRGDALLAAFAAVLLPCGIRYSTTILRDVPYVFMITCAIAAEMVALDTQKWRYWSGMIVFTVLAGLFRREWGEIFLCNIIMGTVILFYAGPSGKSLRHRIFILLQLAISCGVIISFLFFFQVYINDHLGTNWSCIPVSRLKSYTDKMLR